MKSLLLKIIGGFTAVLALFAGLAPFVVINESDSVPHTLFLAKQGKPEKGDYLDFCVPDTETTRQIAERFHRPLKIVCNHQQNLLKPIVAQEGDEVEVTPQHVAVNGTAIPNSKQASQIQTGIPETLLPRGKFKVGAGEYWVIANFKAGSYDSRYFGPVRKYLRVVNPVEWRFGNA